MLYGVVGDFRNINSQIIRKALEDTPALLIDSANFADIHKFKDFGIDKYAKLYVMQVDSLYRFIPTIKQINSMAKRYGTKNIYFTSFTRLFDYDDPQENNDIYIYAWDLLERYSIDNNIYVAVEENTTQEYLSKVYNMKVINMGHTNTSQRMVLDQMIRELQYFGKALDERDRQVLGNLLDKPLKHLGSINYASPLRPEIFLLLSIILEQQKRIDLYEQLVDRFLSGAGKSSAVAQE